MAKDIMLAPIESLNPLQRLTRDLTKAGATMSTDEAGYLVSAYYDWQEKRKASGNQENALDKDEKPHAVITYFKAQEELLEGEIKKVLDKFTDAHPIGRWLKDIHGIGPVIAAGLIAHLNIEKAETAGAFWRFAGLDPTVNWYRRDVTAKHIADHLAGRSQALTMADVEWAANFFGRRTETLVRYMTNERGKLVLTQTSLTAACARLPWNMELKTLCWKVGQSFMKFSGHEDCHYGHMYRERKAYEVARNDRGGNTEAALKERKRIGKETETYKWLAGCYPAGTTAAILPLSLDARLKHLKQVELPEGEGLPMLGLGQLDSRARRYAVKIFLSHLHQVWYEFHHGRPAPRPFAVEHLGHAHVIPPFNFIHRDEAA